MEHPENNEEYKGLTVNGGVEQPSIINPYLKRGRFRRRELSAGEMVEGIVRGDITVLSQAGSSCQGTGSDREVSATQRTVGTYRH